MGNVKVPDLADYSHASGLTPFGVFLMLDQGIPDSFMEPFGDLMSVPDLWSVAFYTVTLRYQPKVDPKAPGGIKSLTLEDLAFLNDAELADQLKLDSMGRKEVMTGIRMKTAFDPATPRTTRK
jgi:hypothetical protein